MVSLHINRNSQVAIGIGLVVIIIDFIFFLGRVFFVPVFAAALVAAWFPYVSELLRRNAQQKELEARFPDFVRNLTSGIKSGIPATKAVIQAAETDYGALTPHVRKLAHQLEWSLPFHKAISNFATETNNTLIQRSVATMIQAEKAGGNIEDVLLSITESLLEVKRIKEERSASIHGQIVQSYVIFFVFLAILIVIQNLLIPFISNFGGADSLGIGGAGAGGLAIDAQIQFNNPAAFVSSLGAYFVSLKGIFLMLALIQGLFAGIVLGKLSSGDVSAGYKHSMIMMITAFIVMSLAQGF